MGTLERQKEAPIFTSHTSQALAPTLLISYDDDRVLSIGTSHQTVVKRL